jgi:HNH endonuclease
LGPSVDELNRAARVGVRPRAEVLAHAQERLTEVRAYRPPQRPELLRLPGRDLRTESLDALTAWSREAVGKLSCGDYMRWRRGRQNAPGRNTIVRQFGSWHAALEAAGLGDRIARAPRRAGGDARRAALREQQRALVVAAVQRFAREHGRWPRALEFFRWRLEAAVDAPPQATVYNRFPGGWAEVLEAAAA